VQREVIPGEKIKISKKGVFHVQEMGPLALEDVGATKGMVKKRI